MFLLATERKGRPFPGRTFWGYMLLYAISRFIIEFYRGDERGLIMGVSTSQFISLILAPLSVIMLVVLEPPAAIAGARARGQTSRLTVDRHSLIVASEEAGVRIDRYLAGVLPGQSRSQVQRLIKDGKVHIAGQPVKSNRVLHAGDEIDVEIPEPTSAIPRAGSARRPHRLSGLGPGGGGQTGRHGRAPGGGPRPAERW